MNEYLKMLRFYGKNCLDLGNYDLAHQIYGKKYSIEVKLKGEKSYSTMHTIMNIGNVFSSRVIINKHLNILKRVYKFNLKKIKIQYKSHPY
jgi:hypothetical protein